MATSGRGAAPGTMKFYIGDGKDSVGSTDVASFSSSTNSSNSSASDVMVAFPGKAVRVVQGRVHQLNMDFDVLT